MKSLLCEVLVIFVFLQISSISASGGDQSPFYQTCVKKCINGNCTEDGSFTSEAASQQDFSCWVLRWACDDECRYQCMWRTVDIFRERGYDEPKFHGKWPFIRWFGVQEPAAAFASLLNLGCHIYMQTKLLQFSDSASLVLFWIGFSFVCENAWFWSAVFHTRDTWFTEFMDYACALSMVMALLVAAIVRVYHHSRKQAAWVLLLSLFCYYIAHVRHLYSGKIDYWFNMVVNVVLGVIGGLIWLLWSLTQWIRSRRAAKMIAFTVLSGAALSLELLDFPPKLHSWDAHALWHLATAPLPLLFYGFVIEDLNFLHSEELPTKTVQTQERFKLS